MNARPHNAPNKRLKLTVRALYIEACPLRRAARAARSLSAVREAHDSRRWQMPRHAGCHAQVMLGYGNGSE